MTKHSPSRLGFLMAACMLMPPACTAALPADVRQERQDDAAGLGELRKLVEAFAVGVGDEAAFSKLEQMPRDGLISSLNRLKEETPGDDPLQVKIAFLMCRLNYNYDENREVVARTVSQTPPFQELHPDETISFVEDLINRGDKRLLAVVIAAEEWADGALGEAVSGIIYKAAAGDLDSLLRNLADAPASARSAVYAQLKFNLKETADKEKLLRRLKAKSKDKTLGPLAEEMAQNID